MSAGAKKTMASITMTNKNFLLSISPGKLFVFFAFFFFFVKGCKCVAHKNLMQNQFNGIQLKIIHILNQPTKFKNHVDIHVVDDLNGPA